MDQAVSHSKFDAEIRSLQGAAATYVSAKGWILSHVTYPTLAVVLRHFRTGREIEFRFACDSWDEHPPSLALHSPEDGHELQRSEWPSGGWVVHGAHPHTGKPFLCLPGIREYHTHPSHVGVEWEGYRLRGTYRLRDIVDRVHQRFNDSSG